MNPDRVFAALASLLAPGAGHFLLGRYRRGAAWALGLPALFLGLLWAMPSPWLFRGYLFAGVLVLLARVASAFDAFRIRDSRPVWKWVAVAWAVQIAFELLLWSPVRGLIRDRHAQAFRIPSNSMRPTVVENDYVLVDKGIYRTRSPRRGEVVVVAHPRDETQKMLKRIVALPGERVQVRGGHVTVDGRPLAEPYVANAAGAGPQSGNCDHPYACEPVVVPPESYFVLGDDRWTSEDSRHWGFVGRDAVSGRAVGIYWSWDKQRFVPRFDRVGRAL